MFTSIRHTISLASAGGMLLTLILVVIITQITAQSIFTNIEDRVTSQLEDKAKATLESSALQQAAQVEQLIQPVLANLSQLQAVLEETAKSRPTAQHVSDLFYSIMSSQNEAVFAGYMVWETPAWELDFGDGFNKSSILAPFYSPKKEGGFDIIPMDSFSNAKLNQNGERTDEWHLAPFETGKTFIMEPYYYDVRGEQALITTISGPITVEGKIYGSFGFDLSLAELQEQSKSFASAIFEGQGSVALLSWGGTYLSDTRNAENLGKKINGDLLSKWPDIRSSIAKSGVSIQEHGDHYQAYAPISTGGNSWLVRVDVPKSYILQSTNEFSAWLGEKNTTMLFSGIVSGILAMIIGSLLIWMIAGQISKVLKNLVERFREIAEGDGDLTYRLEVKGKDETAQLSHWFNNFISNLQETIKHVTAISREVENEAENGLQQAGHTSQNMDNQQGQINSVATAMNEMAASAMGVADNARKAAEAATEAQQNTNSGATQITNASSSVDLLSQRITSTEKEVKELAESSSKIHNILEVIGGISDQTNLLALNAAIEAARAGDNGRGFAVVADEVRSLAMKTQESTGEIKEMLDQLKNKTLSIVNLMQQSREQAEQSASLSNDARITLDAINNTIATINDMNTQIACAASEQSSVSEEINRNVVNIDTVAAQVSDGAKQASQTSSHLANQIVGLRTELDRFKV